MKVLLYSPVFWPSIGGVEIVTDVLAQNLVKLGLDCVVVTESALAGQPELERSYAIVRCPAWRERLALARGASIVHSNAASVAMFPFARWAGVPFVWTHNGYQVSCVDGLGWAYGKPAPLAPWASLRWHARERGLVFGALQAIKLGLRRFVAQRVELNLAGSAWVASRQALPRQFVTYNPYPLARFRQVRDVEASSYDFMYVGRLVGEKGVDVLLQAFLKLVSETPHTQATLAIAGAGDERAALEATVRERGLAAQVAFLGPLRGDEVAQAMAQARIGIVPSTWEEPYGGVSLEWMAAGRNLIVSARGGHAECVGDAGLAFENGDAASLQQCMARLLTDSALAQAQRQRARARIEGFDEVLLTRRFVELYELALGRRQALSVA